MSHAPEPHSDAPTPVPREFNHPLVYTLGLFAAVGCLAWLFFHFKAVGHEQARGEPRFAAPAKGGGEPDHGALISDHSQAVLDRGAVVYGKQCASCHGPQGEPAQAIYRNFKKDQFKNPNGTGPYALYLVLSKGYGNGMPAFQNLSSEDRYAVVHYVRQGFMKGSNSCFTDDDSAEVKKLIPPPGSGAAAARKEGPEFETDPRGIPGPKPLLPLMAVSARAAAGQVADLRHWVEGAAADADPMLKPALVRLGELAEHQPARVARLSAAVRSQDQAAFAAALVAEDGAGSADPVFSLMRREDLQALYARLAAQGVR